MNNPPARKKVGALLPTKPTSFMPFAEIRTNVISGIVVGIVAQPLAIALANAISAPPIAAPLLPTLSTSLLSTRSTPLTT